MDITPAGFELSRVDLLFGGTNYYSTIERMLCYDLYIIKLNPRLVGYQLTYDSSSWNNC